MTQTVWLCCGFPALWVIRSRLAFLLGRVRQSAGYVLGALLHLNLRDALAASWGFVRGWIDPLRAEQQRCCWWGVEGAPEDEGR